jgi:hypothetical protein
MGLLGLSAALLPAQASAQIQVLGGGWAAQANGSPIQSAEGSFINATGITSIIDSSIAGSTNNYSLQLNTNQFPVPNNSTLCNNSGGCTGWVQFTFSNYTAANGYITIEYWIFGAKSCTPPFSSASNGCVYDVRSPFTPGIPISSLNQVKLKGQTVGGYDTASLTVGGQVYGNVQTPTVIKELPKLWSKASFNILGLHNSSTATLNNGSSLTIKTHINNGSTNPPSCQWADSSRESNNFYINSECCPYGGTDSSVVFIEGTSASNPATFPACPSSSAGFISNTVTSSAGSGGTINPSGTFSVNYGATKSFTIAPSSDYNIATPIGGSCGGILNGSSYTTKAITGNCTVTATFVRKTYIVTVSAGANGKISPSGYMTVNSGATQSFTVTPNAGYTASVGGTCGGTPNGNTYTPPRL